VVELNKKTDLTDMSNFPRSIAILLLFACMFSEPGCSSRHVYPASAKAAPASPNAININTASVDELESIPHIGRKTAETIVQFRTENGPFRRPEDLMQIRGISEKRFIEIQTFLRTE
jgi:competence ComEA-like helix-hairpin-helix protein